jgi:hypothetical protein
VENCGHPLKTLPYGSRLFQPEDTVFQIQSVGQCPDFGGVAAGQYRTKTTFDTETSDK